MNARTTTAVTATALFLASLTACGTPEGQNLPKEYPVPSGSPTLTLPITSTTPGTSTTPRPAKAKEPAAKPSHEQHLDNHATDFDHVTFKVTANKRASYDDPIVVDYTTPDGTQPVTVNTWHWTITVPIDPSVKKYSLTAEGPGDVTCSVTVHGATDTGHTYAEGDQCTTSARKIPYIGGWQ